MCTVIEQSSEWVTSILMQLTLLFINGLVNIISVEKKTRTIQHENFYFSELKAARYKAVLNVGQRQNPQK